MSISTFGFGFFSPHLLSLFYGILALVCWFVLLCNQNSSSHCILVVRGFFVYFFFKLRWSKYLWKYYQSLGWESCASSDAGKNDFVVGTQGTVVLRGSEECWRSKSKTRLQRGSKLPHLTAKQIWSPPTKISSRLLTFSEEPCSHLQSVGWDFHSSLWTGPRVL